MNMKKLEIGSSHFFLERNSESGNSAKCGNQ